jgi:hypothetical protein
MRTVLFFSELFVLATQSSVLIRQHVFLADR